MRGGVVCSVLQGAPTTLHPPSKDVPSHSSSPLTPAYRPAALQLTPRLSWLGLQVSELSASFFPFSRVPPLLVLAS